GAASSSSREWSVPASGPAAAPASTRCPPEPRREGGDRHEVLRPPRPATGRPSAGVLARGRRAPGGGPRAARAPRAPQRTPVRAMSGRLGAMASPQLQIAQDETADALLATDPFALLTGMLLDQQFPMERAFAGPAKIKERFGGLDPAAIA